MPDTELLKKMAQKLRRHSLESTAAAGSGHPTTCMSCAEIMAALFFEEMRFDPDDPTGRDADVMVMSKGHAAPILWAALQTLPIMAVDAVDHNGKLKPWRILWSLIWQPGQLGELRRLAANTRAATNSLEMVCRKTLPDFYLPKARGNTIRQLREAGDLHS